MSQPLVIMTPEQLEEFGKKLLSDFVATTGGAQPAEKIEIIDPAELCKRLGISLQTQIRYRKKGKIPYLEIGGSIRYNWTEVIKSLEK